jgi:hypothetical protein
MLLSSSTFAAMWIEIELQVKRAGDWSPRYVVRIVSKSRLLRGVGLVAILPNELLRLMSNLMQANNRPGLPANGVTALGY